MTKFRKVATALVRPFIRAFKVYTVPLLASPGRSAVAVEVPRSPEALVAWDAESWRYPKRIGTDIVWLGESDLEAAYRRRFALQQDVQTYLQRLHDQLRLHREPRRVWVVVAATPSVPAPLDTVPVINPSVADPIMSEILQPSLPAVRACYGSICRAPTPWLDCGVRSSRPAGHLLQNATAHASNCTTTAPLVGRSMPVLPSSTAPRCCRSFLWKAQFATW